MRRGARRLALFDQSSFAKFLVQGRDACAVLNRMSAADVDVAAGRIVYTQWLNERGGIEADLTVTRLAETSSWWSPPAPSRCATSPGCSGTSRRTPAATPPTSPPACRCSASWGRAPASSWQRLCGEDLSNAAFPFGDSRELEVGYARVRASRITYVGELGWELYIPAEFAPHVFDTILKAGGEFGLCPPASTP